MRRQDRLAVLVTDMKRRERRRAGQRRRLRLRDAQRPRNVALAERPPAARREDEVGRRYVRRPQLVITEDAGELLGDRDRARGSIGLCRTQGAMSIDLHHKLDLGVVKRIEPDPIRERSAWRPPYALAPAAALMDEQPRRITAAEL